MKPQHSPYPLTITTQALLLDGPILSSQAPSKQERLASDMAYDLLKYDAFRNESDAFWTLFNRQKWSSFDIMVCLPRAMWLATREIVAEAMSDV